jgi:TonB family protein
MKRFGFALLMFVLLAAPLRPAVAADPPSAATPASAVAARDRLSEVVGTWSCRTAIGGTARVVLEQPAPDTVVLREEEYFARDTLRRRETFRRDAATGGWRAEPDGSGFSGRGPAWTGDAWVLEGVLRAAWLATPEPRQLHLERLDADTLRIYSTLVKPDETAGGALCRRGGTPPDSGTCVVPNAPAYAVRASEPNSPFAGASGLVRVLVSLDASSRVTNVKIQQSPNPALDAASLAAARTSTFRTGLRDCKPVPSEYLFTIQFVG